MLIPLPRTSNIAVVLNHLTNVEAKPHRRVFPVFLLSLIVLVLCLWPQFAAGQNVQHTRNKADLALRSDLQVDPATLGMSIQIPLTSYPGRAGTGLPVSLNYSSKQWRINYSSADSFGTSFYTKTEARFAEYSTAGWTTSIDVPRIEYSGQIAIYDVNGNTICVTCEGAPAQTEWYYIARINVHLPDGSSHELRKDDVKRNYYYEPYATGFSGVFSAVDGSRTLFETATNKLWLPDGSYYVFGPLGYYQGHNEQRATQYVDRNGNTLSYNESARQWTDTLGRLINNPLPQTPVAGQDTSYSISTVGGSLANYTLKWKSLLDARTGTSSLLDKGGFNCNVFPPVATGANSLFPSNNRDTICSEGQVFNPVVLSEIVLPNGLSYRFTYTIWGEIDKVYLPTGGYERYEYAQVTPLGYVTFPYTASNRGIVNRWVSADGITETQPWQYEIMSTSPYTVRSTTPEGTRTERVLLTGGSTNYFGFDSALAGMTSEERVYAANNGGMLRRRLTEWATAGPTSGGASTATRNPRAAKEVQILLDAGVDALATITTYDYDSDLNVISTSKYDFASVNQSTAQTGVIASIPTGALARAEEATFLVNDPAIDAGIKAAYRARNFVSLPTSSRVKNAAGTIVAQGELKYDEAAYAPLTYGVVTGWSDPGTSVRGQTTTGRSWLNTNGSWLETHAQYDQCGSPRKGWDARGYVSEVQYSSAYHFAYPTRSVSPDPDGAGAVTPLETTSVYDFNTGLVTSTSDANSQTTSFAYNDSLNRLTMITRPAGGGWTSYTYGNSPGNPSGSTYVETRTALDAGRSIYQTNFSDGLGRPSRSFLFDGAQYVTSDTQYDTMGRAWRVSNPYLSSGSTNSINPSGLWTTTGYDALGRVLNVTTPDSPL